LQVRTDLRVQHVVVFVVRLNIIGGIGGGGLPPERVRRVAPSGVVGGRFRLHGSVGRGIVDVGTAVGHVVAPPVLRARSCCQIRKYERWMVWAIRLWAGVEPNVANDLQRPAPSKAFATSSSWLPETSPNF